MGVMTLFRRRTPSDSTLAVASSGAMEVHGAYRNALEQYAVRTLVDRGVMIEGNLMTQNGAAIDGNIKGQVCVVGKNAALLIRESAHVAGDVYAPIVVVAGRVTGKIEARFVRLYRGSHVKGTIRAARLIVDDGAVIENDAMDAGMTATALPPPSAPTPAPPAPEKVSAPPAAVSVVGGAAPSAEDFVAVLNDRRTDPSWIHGKPPESKTA